MTDCLPLFLIYVTCTFFHIRTLDNITTNFFHVAAADKNIVGTVNRNQREAEQPVKTYRDQYITHTLTQEQSMYFLSVSVQRML